MTLVDHCLQYGFAGFAFLMLVPFLYAFVFLFRGYWQLRDIVDRHVSMIMDVISENTKAINTLCATVDRLREVVEGEPCCHCEDRQGTDRE